MPIYKSFVGFGSQAGTAAPVVTTLESNIAPAIVWSRASIGTYYGTAAGAFTANKTWIAPYGDWSGFGNPYMALWNETGAINGYMTFDRLDANIIEWRCLDAAGNLADLGSLISSTKVYLPEIRVYP